MSAGLHRMAARVKAADDGFPGTFDVILSTTNLDRDGEIVAAYAFEPLPRKVAFDIDHGMSAATTVGSGTPRYEKAGRELHVRGTWASTELAQNTRTLVREGHVGATSVAFMGAKYENRDGVPTIVKAEILNAAFTPIPSNRESVVLAAKNFGGDPDAVLAMAKVALADAEAVLALGGPVTARSVRGLLLDAERVLAENSGPARRRVDAMLRDALTPGPARRRVDDLLAEALGDDRQETPGARFF